MNRLLLLTFISACGVSEVSLIRGLDGKDGLAGSNGHSLVSEYVILGAGLECANAGARLDIYLDLDDSLSVSSGDLFLNGLAVCNGLNGAQGLQGVAGAQGPQGVAGPQGPEGAVGAVGPQGPQGIAGPMGPIGPQGIQGLQGIAGTNGTNGTNATAAILASPSSTCLDLGGGYYTKNNRLYLENDVDLCDGSHDKVEIDSGESYWISATQLAIYSNSVLRIVTFN